MNQEELATHFGVSAESADALQMALEAAGWPYHEDATGRLWSVSPTPASDLRAPAQHPE